MNNGFRYAPTAVGTARLDRVQSDQSKLLSDYSPVSWKRGKADIAVGFCPAPLFATFGIDAST